MAVTTKNSTTVRSQEKQRPVLYLVHQIPLKNADKVVRRIPIWPNGIEHDRILQAVIQKVNSTDDMKFQPQGETYWYEGVPETQEVKAEDLV